MDNVPRSMRRFLISSTSPDTDYSRILRASMELFEYALSNFSNLEQCYLVTGETVPIATIDEYLKRTKSRVAFESFDESQEVLHYDSWFKITKGHMTEIMNMKEELQTLLDPTSEEFKATISNELIYPDECVMWTLLHRKKGSIQLEEVENVEPMVQRILVQEPENMIHYRAKVTKNTKDAKGYIMSMKQNSTGHYSSEKSVVPQRSSNG